LKYPGEIREWYAHVHHFVACRNQPGIALFNAFENLRIDKTFAAAVGLVIGIGFPPFRGGLLAHADGFGLTRLVERMELLSHSYGTRFEPAGLLVETARAGRKFHDG